MVGRGWVLSGGARRQGMLDCAPGDPSPFASYLRCSWVLSTCSHHALTHTHTCASTCTHNYAPTHARLRVGMGAHVQVFLGIVDPNSDMGKLKRACNSQKCIRAGVEPGPLGPHAQHARTWTVVNP